MFSSKFIKILNTFTPSHPPPPPLAKGSSDSHSLRPLSSVKSTRTDEQKPVGIIIYVICCTP